MRAVDTLARLELASARCGLRIVLHGVSSELEDLVEVCGLGELLTLDRR